MSLSEIMSKQTETRHQEIRTAHEAGEPIWLLDTGTDGPVDVLVGDRRLSEAQNRAEIISELEYHYLADWAALSDRGWTLRSVSDAELDEIFEEPVCEYCGQLLDGDGTGSTLPCLCC